MLYSHVNCIFVLERILLLHAALEHSITDNYPEYNPPASVFGVLVLQTCTNNSSVEEDVRYKCIITLEITK